MKTKWFGLATCLLASAAPLCAGDDFSLDRQFSFRLTQPELRREPLPSSAPPVRPQPERGLGAPMKTPEGDLLPPGSRAFQFNGQTYYIIPL